MRAITARRGQGRELAAHFVRHAVGEVILIGGPEVLKWEDGNARSGIRGGSGRATACDVRRDRQGRRDRGSAAPAHARETADAVRGGGGGRGGQRRRRASGHRPRRRDPGEVGGGELLRRRVTVRGLLREAAPGATRSRSVAAETSGRRERRLVARGDRRHRVATLSAVKGPGPRQHLVEDGAGAKRSERWSAGGPAPARATCSRRPEDVPGAVKAGVRSGRLVSSVRAHPLREAEVEDLHAAVVRDEEVLGLQVAVDDALRAPRRGPGRSGAPSSPRSSGAGRRRREPARRGSPSGIHHGGTSFPARASRPKSWMARILGCDSAATAFASRSNRDNALGSSARDDPGGP